ncbi:MAG: ubiquinol-cytochrome C chaperone family protein [Erythrobacter sp.]|nr:ubiquinol-cytochrome C chaperone family protein [Erythrobacter sp.]
MSLFDRLFRKPADPREVMRPLWHRTVEIAREPEWYEHCGVADTLEGRFDMVTAALGVVMLRMEADPELAPRTAYLTEIFVEDMDGQLRQSGVGDLVVGKQIGKLMSTLGGRLGAYRSGFADTGPTLEEAARRNVTLTDDALARRLADRLRALRLRLDATSAEKMLAGEIP